MMLETTTLHMVRVPFDTARLIRSARLQRLPLREIDIGYLVHCELVALFGQQAPKPFTVLEGSGRVVEVLGYSAIAAAQLEGVARKRPEWHSHRACLWNELAGKPMPADWLVGQVLDFEVRVCPVVRAACDDSPRHRKGAEIDVFLARCSSIGTDERVDRENVYRRWLTDRVNNTGGARLLRVRLRSFGRTRLLRRIQGANRTARLCERPSALFEGSLAIENSDAFGALLRRGIGRHRAFGFGMVLLRRSRTSPC